MPFVATTKVRFAHVDPAGIVFYPRYFEMLNCAVEDWFAQDIGVDFKTLHMVQHIGVPTVSLDVTFLSPSTLGDELTIVITPREVGRTSCKVNVVFSTDGADRLNINLVLVCMDLIDKRPIPWPAPMRAKLEAGLVPA